MDSADKLDKSSSSPPSSETALNEAPTFDKEKIRSPSLSLDPLPANAMEEINLEE